MNFRCRNIVYDIFSNEYYRYINEFKSFSTEISYMTEREFVSIYGRNGHIDMKTNDKGKIRFYFEILPEAVLITNAEKIK